ncbi:16S ribosomal RNA methyltransferase A [Halapricum hydrolyticum]|uniref:Probable ribosomal RNA small subunit methyltransferase A n=1 Tax=Halapricum hydrolyticum TaxID=2979991 RepID=A0AAE3ICS7_9EURY|nr:16S ribosomal RNA methyltransferase A [Halapricum hydrolyticum]MCU4718855.1 16S ribosomal RNA methyltransferase A [Halapricum hydrolyticum]MCU4727867.1 16S ribosomal RNA methyltransferase A [Halapricum hydrolyticum]
MDDTDFRDPDTLLARAGVGGNPGRDQHFLIDDRVLDRVPTYATEAGADLRHVLEVGAGTGALTDRLLAVADHVTAVERDPGLAAFLREEFADEIDAGRLTVLEGDALEVELPEFTASISNLPYGISSEITFRLLPRGVPLVLMFQREFADRMAAEPGSDDYGRLSVTAGHYADVEVVEPVPKEAFRPPPAVESAIVRTTPREPEYEVPSDAVFMDLVKAIFTQRRKTMRNAIRNTAHISGLGDPEAVVDAADEDLMSKRAGDVTPAEFAKLARLAVEVGDP